MIKFIFLTMLFLSSYKVSAQNIPNCFSHDPPQSLLTTALNNVLGLGYTREALNAALTAHPGSQACYTGTVLSKNIYQYFKFLIKIQVRTGSDVHNEFNLLYQDASIQAHHGLVQKPWVGLSRADVEAVMENFLSKADFVPVNSSSTDPMEIALQSDLYKSSSKSCMIETLMPHAISDKDSMIGWMNHLHVGNPDSEAPVAVLFRKTASNLEMAQVVGLQGQILFPLENALQAELTDLDPVNYSKHLLDISVVSP